jgi:hypothetical protein
VVTVVVVVVVVVAVVVVVVVVVVVAVAVVVLVWLMLWLWLSCLLQRRRKMNHKSRDLLRVGLNDFGEKKLQVIRARPQQSRDLWLKTQLEFKAELDRGIAHSFLNRFE